MLLSPDMIQLFMWLPQELFLSFFHNIENSGAGCEYLECTLKHFCVSTCVLESWGLGGDVLVEFISIEASERGDHYQNLCSVVFIVSQLNDKTMKQFLL